MSTSVSLLDRLKRQPTPADWQRLHELYLPLIRHWLGTLADLRDEADDLAQEVLVVLFRALPGFERQREGSFRAWLKGIVVNRVRSEWSDRKRRPKVGLHLDVTEAALDQLADPHSELSHRWDRDHDKFVFDKLLRAVQPDFSETTWEAFTRFAVQGQPAARVADELNLTENAVLLAKQRVLKRLREEAAGLID